MDKFFKGLVLIPVYKKKCYFYDDVIRKIGDKTLIEYSIGIAAKISNNICLLTDSVEIEQVCRVYNIRCLRDLSEVLPNYLYLDDVRLFVSEVLQKYEIQEENILFLNPYYPFLDIKFISYAVDVFFQKKISVAIVKKNEVNIGHKFSNSELNVFLTYEKPTLSYDLLDMFFIFKLKDSCEKVIYLEDVNEEFKVQKPDDFWIAAQKIKRRKIVFHVYVDSIIGTGHLYRALSFAHEFIFDEVIIVVPQLSKKITELIVKNQYKIFSYNTNFFELINEIRPSVLVNDILSTSVDYMEKLKRHGITLINFEDNGLGATLSDATFNELFDENSLKAENIFTGSQYSFLREEFSFADYNQINDKVKNVLITFGGSDPSDFTLKTLSFLDKNFAELDFNYRVIVGPGYQFKEQLVENIKTFSIYNKIQIYFSPTNVSKIMENIQIAYCSNGRTVMELYVMKIPAIVIPQNEREKTHSFSSRENGFLRVESFNEIELLNLTSKLISDFNFRLSLYSSMNSINFSENKKMIVKKIESIFNEKKSNE